MKLINKLLFVVSILTISLRAQSQTLPRLISEGGRSHTFYPSYDTESYYYSNGRSGDLAHQLKFDSTYGYDWELFGIYSDHLYNKAYQTFDSNNNIITRIAQTGETTLSDTILLYSNLNKDSNVYDARNNLITTYYWQDSASVWIFLYKKSYSYDTNNNMTLLISPGVRDTFVYDKNNHLIQETDQVWNYPGQWLNDQRFNYTYLDSFLISTYRQYWSDTDTSWIDAFATLNAYNASGDLIRKVFMSADFSHPLAPMTVEYLDSNIYDAAHNLIFDYHFSLDTLISPGLYRDSNTYIDNNKFWNVLQRYDTASKTYQSYSKVKTLYNLYNQLTYSITLQYNSMSSLWDTLTYYRYHYDESTSTTITSTTSTSTTPTTSTQLIPNNKANEKLSIYPIPANNLLNIKIILKDPETVTIALYDMQGRLIRQMGKNCSTTNNVSIPVSNIATGNYILSVKGKNTNMTKQIVINH